MCRQDHRAAARLPPLQLLLPPQSASNMGFFVKLKYCHTVAAAAAVTNYRIGRTCTYLLSWAFSEQALPFILLSSSA